MSKPDDEYAVLSSTQQSLLNQRKVDMRLENEKYLRGHGEHFSFSRRMSTFLWFNKDCWVEESTAYSSSGLDIVNCM
jgi:hypothetical protein